MYRNLRILAQNGLVSRILLPDGLERYDRKTHSHYHFQCADCGCITDVEVDYLADLEVQVAQKYNIDIQSHDIVFNGICGACRVSEVG